MARRRAAVLPPSSPEPEGNDMRSGLTPNGGAVPQVLNSDSDDEIMFLDEAPEHLKKQPSNEQTPIIIDDSDDEDDGGIVNGKRRLSDASGSDVNRRKRHANAAAGPSSRPIFIDDSDSSDSEEPPPSRILLKADYLIPIVLEVIPDADTMWIKENLERIMEEIKETSMTPGQHAVDQVVNLALENGEYPRADAKEPTPPPEDIPDYSDPNYHRNDRLGYGYTLYSLDVLKTVFPNIPVNHIRNTFSKTGSQLVPTYHTLHRQSISDNKPYTELKKGRGGKGKQRAEEDAESEQEAAEADVPGRAEARKEKAYLYQIMAKAVEKEKGDMATAAEKQKAEAAREERKAQAEAENCAIQCGCCFDNEAPEDTAACPDGHTFCHDCIRSFAETKLGEQDTTILCMDVSGCQSPFSEQTLALVLSSKTMSLFHRLRQMRDLEMADIEGLETCPFCPFAMVIDNDDEKLFSCLNHECRKVSCRKCRRPDHIPKRCEEIEAELKLNNRHAVEEAMSEALMRKCPKCSQPYVKESGCNKIYCNHCRTMSCYICQQQINGYDHFDQYPGRVGTTAGKCRLWDRQENVTEHARIVQARDAAAQRVIADAANQGVALDAQDVHVDAPVAPPAPQLQQFFDVGFGNPLARLPRDPLLHPPLYPGRPGAPAPIGPGAPAGPQARMPDLEALRAGIDAAAERARAEGRRLIAGAIARERGALIEHRAAEDAHQRAVQERRAAERASIAAVAEYDTLRNDGVVDHAKQLRCQRLAGESARARLAAHAARRNLNDCNLRLDRARRERVTCEALVFGRNVRGREVPVEPAVERPEAVLMDRVAELPERPRRRLPQQLLRRPDQILRPPPVAAPPLDVLRPMLDALRPRDEEGQARRVRVADLVQALDAQRPVPPVATVAPAALRPGAAQALQAAQPAPAAGPGPAAQRDDAGPAEAVPAVNADKGLSKSALRRARRAAERAALNAA